MIVDPIMLILDGAFGFCELLQRLIQQRRGLWSFPYSRQRC